MFEHKQQMPEERSTYQMEQNTNGVQAVLFSENNMPPLPYFFLSLNLLNDSIYAWHLYNKHYALSSSTIETAGI